MVDIATIGAGGGSIARVSASGALTVGPQSAGAVPGPVCYGRGGTEPTVTDAHLVLGHLPPYLLGRQRSRSTSRRRARAIARRVAEPLGMSVEEAARGILAIVDNNMVGAIRVVSVERGHDPRDFVLLPFGGAGPLHGGALARLLGMRTILVPPAPGVLSALGLLVSNLKAEFTRTCLQRAGAIDLAPSPRVFGELEAEAAAWLDRGGRARRSARASRWHASLRYQHQGFELVVPWDGREVDAAAMAATIARVPPAARAPLHLRAGGHAGGDRDVARRRARACFPPPAHARAVATGGPAADAIVARQTIASRATARSRRPVYDRARLGAGERHRGPGDRRRSSTRPRWCCPARPQRRTALAISSLSKHQPGTDGVRANHAPQ